MADNGCGCGCGCAAMADLSYQEKIISHYQTKPYSIDPFNELGTPAEVRDALLVKDFLASYEVLSHLCLNVLTSDTSGSGVTSLYFSRAASPLRLNYWSDLGTERIDHARGCIASIGEGF